MICHGILSKIGSVVLQLLAAVSLCLSLIVRDLPLAHTDISSLFSYYINHTTPSYQQFGFTFSGGLLKPISSVYVIFFGRSFYTCGLPELHQHGQSQFGKFIIKHLRKKVIFGCGLPRFLPWLGVDIHVQSYSPPLVCSSSLYPDYLHPSVQLPCEVVFQQDFTFALI